MNIRVKKTRDGSNAVKTMDIEEYLVGVVSSEMSEGWPMEALMAQAVAARTFALRHMQSAKGRTYDVDDTTAYQAYKDRKPGQCPRVEQAVRDTAGLVLLYGGKPASTNYSASNGGRTVSAKERWGNAYAYLIAKDDPWDKASGYKRYGHGVGMSQRGAQWAANNGVGYITVLAFYFPGTVLAASYGATVTAPVAPPETPKPTEPTTATYTVKKGDSLSKIAKANGLKWPDLAKLNGIKGPLYIIHPGQVLKLK